MFDGLKTALLTASVVMLPLTAIAQPMDYAQRQEFQQSVISLAETQTDVAIGRSVSNLMRGLGLPSAAPLMAIAKPIVFKADDAAVIELVDIRLLLAQVAIQSGAREHLALVRAQGARDHDVILLRAGFATMDDLFQLSRGTLAQDFVTQTADGLVLTRPLAIWADAGLSLGKTDQLILDRPSGSFVANLGWLNLSGGTIVGTDGPNTAEPDFRPFVLTAGRGAFTADAANFRALGFGQAAVFGGIAIVNNGLSPPRLTSTLTNSTLSDVSGLGLLGTTGAKLIKNNMIGSAGTAILISQAQASVVANNRLSGLTGPQAIRVTAGASDVTISGNLVSGSPRTGILIDRDSRSINITGNLVQGSLTTAVAVDSGTCIAVTANLLASNGGAAVTLSDTDATTISANAILFNRGAGVLVRDQGPAAQVWVAGNVFVGNREALRGATPGQVALQDNDFENQLPRVFAGDFAPLMVDWLRQRSAALPASATAMPASAACPDLTVQ